jgi:hypothetical protein
MNLVRFFDLIFAMDVSGNSDSECRIPGNRCAAISACGEMGMLCRALGLAAIMFVAGCGVAEQAGAQENLEAGKSPSQIFAGTCAACHKSPRGLMKTVNASSLPGFLRQHYTTSSNMAGVLASYLTSNGATDTRYATGQKEQPKGAKDGIKDGVRDGTKEASREVKPDAHPLAPTEQIDRFSRRQHPVQDGQEPRQDPRQAARPDAEPGQQGEAGPHAPRNARQRLARPSDSPEVAHPEMDGQTPAQAASDRGPDGRKLSAKQRLSKRGKPEEMPKPDAAKGEEPGGAEPMKLETAKPPETARPGSGSESATAEPGKEPASEIPALRVDPVPAVTPAPPPSAAVQDQPVTTSTSGTDSPPAAASSSAPAVTASAPPLPPVPPAGPPAPPISQ